MLVRLREIERVAILISLSKNGRMEKYCLGDFGRLLEGGEIAQHNDDLNRVRNFKPRGFSDKAE